MKLSSGKLIVTKQLRKTQAEVFKLTKIGDIVEFVTFLSPAYGMVNTVTFYNYTRGLHVNRDQTTAANNMKSFEYRAAIPWEGYGDAKEMFNLEEGE